MEADPGRYVGILRDAFRKHYVESSDVWTDDLAMRVLPPIVQGRLKLPRETRVLDVGCGAGRDVAYFAEVFDTVVGLDIHPHPGWEDVRRAAPNVRFVCEGLLEHDGAYDLVVDNGCFHHQHPDHARPYLERVARLAAGGGFYVLSTFKNDALASRVDANGRLHRYFSDAELHGALEAPGFTVFDELDVWRNRHRDYYRLTFCKTKGA